MHTRVRTMIALALVGAGGALAASASGSIPVAPPNAPPEEKQLDVACATAVASVQKVLSEAGTMQVKTITSTFQVVKPGTLMGELAFNRSGKSIRVGAGHPPVPGSQTYGCGESSAGGRGLGPGRSRVVSTLQRTFSQPGRYTLSFRLNQTGQRLLGQLAAAQRTYHRLHPHGKRPPGLAFGVSLDYAVPARASSTSSRTP